MTTTTQTLRRAGLSAILVATVLTPLAVRAQDPATDLTPAQRLEKLQAEGRKAAMTILPVFVMEQPNRNVADVLGLVLEKAGFDNLAATDTPFTPPTDTAWEKWPAALGDFVRQNPPTTAYVLFADFAGTPQTGPQSVRFIIVDQQGGLVLADRQLPSDPDFKRIAAVDPDPMGCSALVGERVHKLLKLPAAKQPAPEGKFAKLWAEKSGTPGKAEVAAMEKAQKELKAALRGSDVLVFPTRINGVPNAEQAKHLADALAKEHGCKTHLSDTPFVAEIAPSSNQQRRLWDLARTFRDYVREHKPDAPYALVADHVIAPDGRVWAVHLVVCDRAGEWVIVDFQNDLQPDYKSIAPKSADDCDRLTLKRLASYLR
jgi:hypothetical protein